jgi:isoleucine--tRNA ligase
LDASDYEIAYEGLDAHDTAVEGNMIAQLDLNITPELEREGVVREFSRFLNQMRKDADFSIDAKVVMTYETPSEEMERLIAEFDEVLRGEALLKNIQKGLEK